MFLQRHFALVALSALHSASKLPDPLHLLRDSQEPGTQASMSPGPRLGPVQVLRRAQLDKRATGVGAALPVALPSAGTALMGCPSP